MFAALAPVYVPQRIRWSVDDMKELTLGQAPLRSEDVYSGTDDRTERAGGYSPAMIREYLETASDDCRGEPFVWRAECLSGLLTVSDGDGPPTTYSTLEAEEFLKDNITVLPHHQKRALKCLLNVDYHCDANREREPPYRVTIRTASELWFREEMTTNRQRLRQALQGVAAALDSDSIRVHDMTYIEGLPSATDCGLDEETLLE